MLEKKNANEIFLKFKNVHPNIVIINEKYQTFYIMLEYIAYYIKHAYSIENISIQNEYAYYSANESDFIKINGQILWVIGILNNSNYRL